MKESYSKGVATHAGHESCLDDPRGRGEALAVVRAGGQMSSEITVFGCGPGGALGNATFRTALKREWYGNPAESMNLACTETLCTGIGRSGRFPRQRHLAGGKC